MSFMVLFLSPRLFLNFSLVHCSLEIVFLEGLWLGWKLDYVSSLFVADRGGGGSSVLKKSCKNGEEESRLNTDSSCEVGPTLACLGLQTAATEMSVKARERRTSGLVCSLLRLLPCFTEHLQYSDSHSFLGPTIRFNFHIYGE